MTGPPPDRVARAFTAAGALLGLLGVAAGALGAHALEGRLSPELVVAFETGARYQVFHALALVACGWWRDRVGPGLVTWAGVSLLVGTLLFSGSLYLLAVTGWGWPGPVTPVGGSILLLAWGLLGVSFLRDGTPSSFGV